MVNSSTLIPRAHLCPSSWRPVPNRCRWQLNPPKWQRDDQPWDFGVSQVLGNRTCWNAGYCWVVCANCIPIVCFGSVGSFCHNWVWATLAHQPWEDRRFGRLHHWAMTSALDHHVIAIPRPSLGLPSWSHDGCTPKILQIIASGKPMSWLS